MALNLDAIGKKIGPFTKDYTWKDAALYALGVGAGFSDLDYCYEKDLKVIPSYGITTLYDFMPELAATSNVNLAGVLHGEQELIFHNPIPPEGTLTTEGTDAGAPRSGPICRKPQPVCARSQAGSSRMPSITISIPSK